MFFEIFIQSASLRLVILCGYTVVVKRKYELCKSSGISVCIGSTLLSVNVAVYGIGDSLMENAVNVQLKGKYLIKRCRVDAVGVEDIRAVLELLGILCYTVELEGYLGITDRLELNV
jgi:hypothetical protein